MFEHGEQIVEGESLKTEHCLNYMAIDCLNNLHNIRFCITYKICTPSIVENTPCIEYISASRNRYSLDNYFADYLYIQMLDVILTLL